MSSAQPGARRGFVALAQATGPLGPDPKTVRWGGHGGLRDRSAEAGLRPLPSAILTRQLAAEQAASELEAIAARRTGYQSGPFGKDGVLGGADRFDWPCSYALWSCGIFIYRAVKLGEFEPLTGQGGGPFLTIGWTHRRRRLPRGFRNAGHAGFPGHKTSPIASSLSAPGRGVVRRVPSGLADNQLKLLAVTMFHRPGFLQAAPDHLPDREIIHRLWPGRVLRAR